MADTTNTEVDPKILERVRRLLAKAENTEHQGEAELFFEKATELIMKYGIDAMMLNPEQARNETPADRRFNCRPPYAFDKMHLLNAMARALGCQGVYVRKAGGVVELHLFGMQSDLDQLDLLFTSLLIQAMRLLGRQPLPSDPVRQKVYKRDWLQGFTVSVATRLRKIRERTAQQTQQERTDDGPSTALVLADRSEAVGKAMEAAYPTTRKARRGRSPGAGFGHGYRDGEQADLGQKRAGGAQRDAIS